jgi:FAD/FMN-containing dehydrogenase
MSIVQRLTIHIKKPWPLMKRSFLWVMSWLRRLVPGRRARQGATVGVFVTTALLFGYAGALILRTGWGIVFDVLMGATIGVVAIALVGLSVSLLLILLSKIPRLWGGLLLGAVAGLTMFLGSSPPKVLPFSAGITLVGALIGGAVGVITAAAFKTAPRTKQISVSLVLFFSILAVVGFVVWTGQPGTEEGLVKVEEKYFTSPDTLDAPDPSRPGRYEVRTLTYGSGDDRRDEFGANAQIKTKTVDGKPFVNKLDGWLSPLRKRYWGFDRRRFPLNGRVWYPAGDGCFPLVLIVHGNHLMRDYSDPGYAYLGELLASRGFIFVSVDENFLNGDWSQNYDTENDARAWVLLEHLRVWRGWNADTSNPFCRKVDMDRISLIGHSRGGEAVSVAAAFNGLSRYPDDARVKFDYGFKIRSVVGIAPIDGQYRPADQSTPMKNINYLLLQGSHDADVFFFSGDRQYKRVEFTGDPYCFKTSLYIYRANHGQFNTVWANRDWGLPQAYILNTKALLAGEEQRRIARVYISAFLEATLKENRAYLPLFRNWRTGASWLPKTLYISRFEDSRTRYVCDFSEDIDVTTTTVSGGVVTGEGLATWREKDLGLRGGDPRRENQVVCLGWRYEDADSSRTDSARTATPSAALDSSGADTLRGMKPARYSITLPTGLAAAWKLDASSVLTFSVAEVDEEPAKPDSLEKSDEEQPPDTTKIAKKGDDKKGSGKEGEQKKDEGSKPRTPINFTVEVLDLDGQTASIPLGEVLPLMPPLKARFTRFGPFEENFRSPSEPVLQTVEIPASLLLKKNGRFDAAKIGSVVFRFDRSRKGVILLDEIGFRR